MWIKIVSEMFSAETEIREIGSCPRTDMSSISFFLSTTTFALSPLICSRT
jgi:hypothetical protein